MTNKNPRKDQTITPAGKVELNEEELDQATGGNTISGKIPEKGYTSQYSSSGGVGGGGDGKTGGSVLHKGVKYGDIT